VRKDGLFIAVEVGAAAAADIELAKKLTEACPVDIFAQAGDGTLELVEQSLDECVLCRLCLDAAPTTPSGRGARAVNVIKLYDNDAVLA
jgi:ferredoxin-like protein FixX